MKFLIFGVALCLGTTVSANYLSEKPPFLKSCYLTDSNFKSCYANSFQTLVREWKDGIPGLKIVGKLDPIHVERVIISQAGTGSVTLNADLTNIVIKGASKAQVSDASLSKDMVAEVKVSVPKLSFEADYKLDGRVLALVLNGHGKANFEAENVIMVIRVSNKLRDEDGLVFSDVEDVKVDIKEIGNFHIILMDLFQDDKVLEKSANDFFNTNWRDLFEVLREPIVQNIQTVLHDRLKKIVKFVPATYFVADLPTAAEFYG